MNQTEFTADTETSYLMTLKNFTSLMENKQLVNFINLSTQEVFMKNN